MEKRTLTFHTDPGHGWLQVHFRDLLILGINAKISGYSYMKVDQVYLEEDCDAYTFLKAAKEAGWEIHTNENYVEKTPIRHYPRYKGQMV